MSQDTWQGGAPQRQTWQGGTRQGYASQGDVRRRDDWGSSDRKEGHPRDERSLGELLNSAARDVGLLMRQELELAKVELREEAATASKAGAKVGAGAVIGHLALLLASFAAAWGLAEVMHPAWAFLIVAVVYAVVAAVLFAAGRKQFREMSAVPRQTVETLKEDASWAREQMRLGTTSPGRGRTSARRSTRSRTA